MIKRNGKTLIRKLDPTNDKRHILLLDGAVTTLEDIREMKDFNPHDLPIICIWHRIDRNGLTEKTFDPKRKKGVKESKVTINGYDIERRKGHYYVNEEKMTLGNMLKNKQINVNDITIKVLSYRLHKYGKLCKQVFFDPYTKEERLLDSESKKKGDTRPYTFSEVMENSIGCLNDTILKYIYSVGV